ncbi:DUF397 domain-containing protein [Streptodolium elevatio]|uniref:DUF397 domain-containing protein n=1 Tax=Streptodolium elevatio TaxID=3157996 RepID=A0ABV3DMT6_9ACTN
MPDAAWSKSSYSAPTDDNCVETARLLHDAVGVQDSKDLTKGHFTVPTQASE